jgi:hypothetical protein
MGDITAEFKNGNLSKFFILVHVPNVSQEYVLRNLKTGQSIINYKMDPVFKRPPSSGIMINKGFLKANNLLLFKFGGV